MTPTIRRATAEDAGHIWDILAPVIVSGETYALPRAWGRGQAIACWVVSTNRRAIGL